MTRRFDPTRELRARWSLKENDVQYHYPRSADGHLLHYHLYPLVDELKKRGYDVTTLRFSVRRACTEPEA